jgi:hypothetical protein
MLFILLIILFLLLFFNNSEKFIRDIPVINGNHTYLFPNVNIPMLNFLNKINIRPNYYQRWL